MAEELSDETIKNEHDEDEKNPDTTSVNANVNATIKN